MAKDNAQEQNHRPDNGLLGSVADTFTHGLKSAQQLSEKAATMPWTMLEGMGIPEEKTKGPKEFNLKLVGGVFRLTDKMANRALDFARVAARWLVGEIRPPELPSTAKTAGADDKRKTKAATEQRKPAGRVATRAQTAKFNFTGNAEAIYDKSISSTPLPFRKNTRDGLTGLLLERFGENTEITEADMVEIIKEHTPKPFLGKGMKAIKPLLSDPSLAE